MLVLLRRYSENREARIIATGPNKDDIDSYFIEIDKLISLPVKDIITAVDYLFKCRFVFDTHFEADLQSFYRYMEYYFYNIGNEEKLTPTLRKVHTQLEHYRTSITNK